MNKARPSLGQIVRYALGRQPATEGKAYPGSGVEFVGAPDWRQVIALSGYRSPDAEELVREIAFATSAYCYSAMLYRASRVAEPPLMVVREDEDGEEWLPDHPLAPLLDSPRPDVDMGEILTRTQLYRDGTGAALWVLDRNLAGARARVTPYSALEFRSYPDPAAGLIFGRYTVTDARGAGLPVRPEDVVHFRDVNPASWRDPLPRLDAALAALNLGHQVNRIVKNYVTRAMFPGGVISPDKDWNPTPQEWADWKATIELWHGGPANAGAPLAVRGGTTVSSTATGLADLLPKDLLDRVEATVGSVFGTPPVVLGWQVGLENSPWSQMSEARRQTYEDTIEPIWRDVERRLARVLLTPEERAAGLLIRFDTRQVRALRDDDERQARIAALNADHWTVNERRVATGQDPLPPEDPRGEKIAGMSATGDSDLAGIGGPPAPGATEEEDDEEELPPDEEPEEEEQPGKALGSPEDLAWALFDVSAKASEGQWERTVYAALQETRAAILRDAQATLREGKAADDDSVRRFLSRVEDRTKRDRSRLLARLGPLVRGTGEAAVKRLGARLGLSFSVLEPGLLDYARTETAFLVKVMGETTGRLVADAVQAGLAEGATVRNLMKRLADLPAFSRDRAKMVARTETTRAWNGAQRRSIDDYARREKRTAYKLWLSARDARVRDEHRELDGEKRAIDAAFSNGLQEPGEPNCRCTLLYGFEDTSAPLEGTTP